MNPLIERFGDRQCWLICNADKTPCDRAGRPLACWQTRGATLTDALRFVDGERVRGVGIRVNAAPGLVALDLDDCLNSARGVVDELALLPLLDVPTYCEITWSGNSLRAYYILSGEHAPVHRHDKNDPREVYYNTAKFVIITGNAYHLHGHAPTAELATITPAQLDAWLAMFDRRRAYSDDEELAQLHELHAITRDVETAQALRELVAAREAERVAQHVRSFAPADLLRSGRGLIALREHVRAQREGNRNAALFWAACRAAEQGMHEHEISELLADAARSTGLAEREIAATIRSAARSVTR